MNAKSRWQKWKRFFPLSWRGWLIYGAAMGLASLVCELLRQVSTSDVHVPLIFILVVLVVSLMTDGYFYGLLAALTSVFTVNVAFTYPYMKMDFSVYGYPLTFLTMAAVGLAVSALTTRVKAQEQLRLESEKEKVRANLMRAVSHDLRTPLTSISGSLSAVLEGGLEPEPQRELLEDARQDADWLCRMVENLLSVTRIGEGRAARLHKQEEALEEVLGAAVLAFRKRNPAIEVSVSVPEEPLFVPMDPVLIQQVLQNLLDNAVTHGIGTSEMRGSGRYSFGFVCYLCQGPRQALGSRYPCSAVCLCAAAPSSGRLRRSEARLRRHQSAPADRLRGGQGRIALPRERGRAAHR